jgi:hypothetical protein
MTFNRSADPRRKTKDVEQLSRGPFLVGAVRLQDNLHHLQPMVDDLPFLSEASQNISHALGSHPEQFADLSRILPFGIVPADYVRIRYPGVAVVIRMHGISGWGLATFPAAWGLPFHVLPAITGLLLDGNLFELRLFQDNLSWGADDNFALKSLEMVAVEREPLIRTGRFRRGNDGGTRHFPASLRLHHRPGPVVQAAPRQRPASGVRPGRHGCRDAQALNKLTPIHFSLFEIVE